MLYNLVYGLRLRRLAPGGVIGERLGWLILMVAFFALAYLGALVLVWSQPSSLPLFLFALVFFLGAIFVYLVLRLVDSLVASL